MTLTFLVIWDINHLKDVMRWEALTLPQPQRALWLCFSVCVCVCVCPYTLLHSYITLLHFTLKSSASPLSLEHLYLLCFSALRCFLSSFSLSVSLPIIPSVCDFCCHSLSISASLTQTLHPLLLDICFLPTSPPLFFPLSLHLYLILSDCFFPSPSSAKGFYSRLNCRLSELFSYFFSVSDSIGSLSFRFCDAWSV